MLKTNQMRRYCKNNAMSETLQTKKFGGGVTHRIGSIRPRHDAQSLWRSKVKFHVNVFTLRGKVFIDLRNTLLRVLHIQVINMHKC